MREIPLVPLAPAPVLKPPVQPEPNPHVPMTRGVVKQILDDEGVTIHYFLKLQTPEFKGVEGEDLEEFLEDIEKMVKRLPCSDSRVIELVGVKLKKNAWS